MEPRRYETCNDRGVHDLAYCPEGHSIESFNHVYVTELVPSPRVEIQRVPVVNDKGYVLLFRPSCVIISFKNKKR